MLDFFPLIIILSQLTTETLFPFLNNFATFDASLPAIKFVPSTTIGVCARYIHSHQTLYAMDDFLEAQAFLQAIVKKLDRSTVDLIKNY